MTWARGVRRLGVRRGGSLRPRLVPLLHEALRQELAEVAKANQAWPRAASAFGQTLFSLLARTNHQLIGARLLCTQPAARERLEVEHLGGVEGDAAQRASSGGRQSPRNSASPASAAAAAAAAAATPPGAAAVASAAWPRQLFARHSSASKQRHAANCTALSQARNNERRRTIKIRPALLSIFFLLKSIQNIVPRQLLGACLQRSWRPWTRRLCPSSGGCHSTGERRTGRTPHSCSPRAACR